MADEERFRITDKGRAVAAIMEERRCGMDEAIGILYERACVALVEQMAGTNNRGVWLNKARELTRKHGRLR